MIYLILIGYISLSLIFSIILRSMPIIILDKEKYFDRKGNITHEEILCLNQTIVDSLYIGFFVSWMFFVYCAFYGAFCGCKYVFNFLCNKLSFLSRLNVFNV